MKNILNEIKKLDKILVFICQSQDFSAQEIDLQHSKLYSLERLDFLEKEGMVFRTPLPTSYRLTQKGIVFISSGGYVGEARKKNLDRKSNLIYLLATPLFAFLSLIVSIIAFYLSVNSKNSSDTKVSNSQNIIYSSPLKCDTIVHHLRSTHSLKK